MNDEITLLIQQSKVYSKKRLPFHIDLANDKIIDP